MSRSGIFCILLYVIGLMLCSHAVAVSRDSFAYGYSLEVDGDGAIYSLYLNDKIYQGLVREDRGDLRIFNSVGESVPHDIRRAEQMTRKTHAPMELPVFPLYTTDRTESISALAKNIRITTNDQGSIIDLNYGKSIANERFRVGYIIDASAVQESARQLQFDWHSDNEHFILNVQLEGSADLSHWRTLVASATLSNMQWNQHTLVQREIELPASLPKYLRLSWSGDVDFDLQKVSMYFSDSYERSPEGRHWSEFAAQQSDDSASTLYFNTNAVYPVDRIKLIPLTRNTLLNISVESASTPQGPWHLRYQGLVYDLQFDQNRLQSGAIPLSSTSHRHWRVRPHNQEGLNSARLNLRLGWVPEQLLFVATGESPFTLTYGSAQVAPVKAALATLLSEAHIKQQGSLIKSARLGAAIDFGDQSRLQPIRPQLDWKRYILWAVLIAGVGLLAFMAIRLYKQMDQTPTNE